MVGLLFCGVSGFADVTTFFVSYELTDTAEESERVVELLFGKKVARVGLKASQLWK